MTQSLVRPLFDGPLDLVGDVHGEIDALRALLHQLGYGGDRHPEGRRLVFVGDLIDRGPDSPGVLALVRRLLDAGQAQCVLGNHELNVLLGSRKPDNVWFFHHELPAGEPAAARPQVWISKQEQSSIREFLAGLPLALERPDLRVVHACWKDDAIDSVRQAGDVVALHHANREQIDERNRQRGLSAAEAKLARQNDDPVKLLTSGPETLADEPFEAMGQIRHERRVAWWNAYDGPLCVFGHYWRIMLPHEKDTERLFTGVPLNALLGRGEAMCVDYSVGKRFLERAAPDFNGRFLARLTALRLPQRELIFDDGERVPLQENDRRQR